MPTSVIRPDKMGTVDVVADNHLVAADFIGSKRDFKVYIKGYVQRVMKYLEANNSEELQRFKRIADDVVRERLGKFKELSFYTGESAWLIVRLG